MSSSARLKSSATFLRSINAQLDADNLQVLSSYLVTPNALRTTRRILDALHRGDGGAWTITGAFGTGKSAFFVFLSNLLGRLDSQSVSRARKLLRMADPALNTTSLGKIRRKFNLVPIVVSGAPKPIASAVLGSILEATEHGRLKASTKLRRRMRQLQAVAGEPASLVSHDLVEIVHEAVTTAASSNTPTQGILLLIDELGKLLEFAAKHPHRSDPFVLQQIAEVAARSQGRFLLLTALHQDFRAYASNLPSTERVEWEKIRGRFEDIAFEEPPDQLLRFLALAWERIRHTEDIEVSPIDEETARSLAPRLWNYGLAPATLAKADGSTLLRKCAPLHPLTAFILGPLFRRIGQNERSAFTFLASQEPRALRSWLSQRTSEKHRLFDVVDLYQYLVSSLGSSILNTVDAKRWAEAFEAEARHPELSPEQVAVLRAVALISASSRWLNIRASLEVIEYALSGRVTPKQIKVALRELDSMSLLVHRCYNDSYVLWEGSDVDIEARLSEGRQRLNNKGSVAGLLRRHYPMRPVLARRHSFESGTLRFFAVDFLTTDELRQHRWPVNSECDGRIFLVLPKDAGDQKIAAKSARELDDSKIIRVLDAQGRFADYALELAAVDWVKKNTPELSHDATARRELHARTISIQRSLDQLFVAILSGDPTIHGNWYHLGSKFPANNTRTLNERLSTICDKTYSDAPRIDNEIINRRQLSSAAAAARRNLIKKMIEAPDQPQLGLTGNPPERSVYRSLLGTEGGLGLHREVKGNWAFRKPPPTSCATAAYAAVSRFLDEAVQEQKQVCDLFDLLARPPFGLRDGPIPVFVCAVFLAREAEVALYEDGIFCPVLTAATMDRMIKSPERFSLRKWHLSGVRKHVFEELERIVLGDKKSAKSQERRLLRVVRPLLRFVSSLPQYTLQTRDLSPDTRAVRDAFAEATEPDVLLFDNLPKACDLLPFSARQRLKDRSTDITTYVTTIKNAFEELRNAYPRLLESVRQSFMEAFGFSSGENLTLREPLQATAANIVEFVVEPDLRLFLSRILERDNTEDLWLQGAASFLAERPVPKWRDEDRAHFNVRLRQFVRRIRLLEATIANRPPQSTAQSIDSIRVSLTGTTFGQLDYSVHLDKKCERKLKKLQTSIQEAISNNYDADSALTVGAICRVLRSRLQEANADTRR